MDLNVFTVSGIIVNGIVFVYSALQPKYLYSFDDTADTADAENDSKEYSEKISQYIGKESETDQEHPDNKHSRGEIPCCLRKQTRIKFEIHQPVFLKKIKRTLH